MVCRSALHTGKPISHLPIHTLIVKGETLTACVLLGRQETTGCQSLPEMAVGLAELGAPRCAI